MSLESLAHAAKKHNIFVLRENRGAIDFIDNNTGSSLGKWLPFPQPRFLVHGVWHGGRPLDCLKAIVAPNQL